MQKKKKRRKIEKPKQNNFSFISKPFKIELISTEIGRQTSFAIPKSKREKEKKIKIENWNDSEN